MKSFTRTLLATTLLSLAAAPALAAEPATPAAAPAAQEQPAESYLGVAIAPVPQALRLQLGDRLPADQGVLVRQVAPGSPADRAGIRPFDILLGFGDQKLFAPEQLVKLVRSGKPGDKVSIELVRSGRVMPVEVTIGRQQAAVRPQTIRPGLSGRRGHHPLSPRTMQPLAPSERNWETFDAISLSKLDDGRYQAVIEYLDVNGGKKRMEFEGSRAEIRDQILRQDDLPEIERNQLLEMLTGRDDLFIPAIPMPRGFYMPRMFDWNPGF